MKLRIRIVLVLFVAVLLSSWSAKALHAQSISVTGGQYSTRTNYEVNWWGTYSLPGGCTNYFIEAWIRPSTSPTWSEGLASWFMYNWTGYGTTDPSAPGSYVGGRLWYMIGSNWYYVDSNTPYIDSPWN